jgi:hypothetical protein
MSTTINPLQTYSLQEVLDKSLIPNVTGYSALYKLITATEPDVSKKLGVKRTLAKETTSRKIKAVHSGNPWNKISGKIKIEGKELIKFLQINNLV